ncbi:hypothetical protein P0F65_21790 [Sphingomonas sp. I4]
MRLSIDVTLDYVLTDPADILLQIEAAATPDQRLEQQSLTIWSDHGVTAVGARKGSASDAGSAPIMDCWRNTRRSSRSSGR